MQPSNAASAIALMEEPEYIAYDGRSTHVRVHLSVEVIKDKAFNKCGQLTTVILNDGLKYIGAWAFRICMRLRSIMIPNTV